MVDLAYAVVHDQPPRVYAAADVEVLQWVIGLEVVARSPASTLDPDTVHALRQALLEERWADAVELWMRASGVPTVEPSLRFVKSAGHLRRTNRSSARRLLPILSKHQGARARGRRGGLAMLLRKSLWALDPVLPSDESEILMRKSSCF